MASGSLHCSLGAKKVKNVQKPSFWTLFDPPLYVFWRKDPSTTAMAAPEGTGPGDLLGHTHTQVLLEYLGGALYPLVCELVVIRTLEGTGVLPALSAVGFYEA